MRARRPFWQEQGTERPRPGADERRRGDPWPPPPAQSITFPTSDGEHHVTVDLAETSGGAPVVIGLSVRRTTPLEPEPRGEDIRPGSTEPPLTEQEVARLLDYDGRKRRAREGLLFRAEPRPLSARDARRLQLGTYVRAAQAIASARFFPVEAYAEDVDKARRILLPKGRPERGRGTKFYRGIAKAYEQFAAQGKNPAVEIAQRKSRELGEEISTNTVHQWIHRARRLEFLVKPTPTEAPRRRGRKKR